MIPSAIANTNIARWLEDRATSRAGQGWFGDGVNRESGLMTAALLSVRKRVTTFVFTWFTSDREDVTTWPDRIGELVANIEIPNSAIGQSTGSYVWTKNFAQRMNFAKAGLAWPAHVTMFPVGREAVGAVDAVGGFATNTLFRKTQMDWADGTLTRPAGVYSFVAAHQSITAMSFPIEAHHSNATPRGNMFYLLTIGHGLARAAGLVPSWGASLPSVASYSGAGTPTITATFNLPPGWGLAIPDAGLPVEEFWAQENGGNWVPVTNTATSVISGNTVVMTKSSGNWHPTTLMQFGRGAPATAATMGDLVTPGSTIYKLGGYLHAEAPVGATVNPLPTGAPVGAGTGLVRGLVMSPDKVARAVS
jgi:hypothetical protein